MSEHRSEPEERSEPMWQHPASLPPPEAVLYPRDKVLLMGTTEQVGSNATSAGQAENRRTVVRLLQNKGIAPR